jgi:hypothetical protein
MTSLRATTEPVDITRAWFTDHLQASSHVLTVPIKQLVTVLRIWLQIADLAPKVFLVDEVQAMSDDFTEGLMPARSLLTDAIAKRRGYTY